MTTSSPQQPALNTLEILTLTISMLVGSLAAVLLLAVMIQNNLSVGINSFNPVWQAAITQQMQAMGLPLQNGTSAYWYMSRASALTGYFFTWGSVLWGLLLSTKVIRNRVSPALTFGVHEFLSIMAIGFAAFHALILLGDHYINFNLANILIPFSAPFKPALVGVGTISFYLYTIILGSFYIRKRIGQKVWRTLHYLTFLTYVLVTAHAVLAGTDTQAMPVQAMYLVSATSVLFLVYYRILSINQQKGIPNKNGELKS